MKSILIVGLMLFSFAHAEIVNLKIDKSVADAAANNYNRCQNFLKPGLQYRYMLSNANATSEMKVAALNDMAKVKSCQELVSLLEKIVSERQ